MSNVADRQCCIPWYTRHPVFVQKNVRQRFGIRLRQLRAERGWSQEELSGLSGIGRVFVSQLENGHKDVCLGVIETLADSFKISIAELMRSV